MKKKQGRPVPNTKEIIQFLHCGQCLIEIAESQEPIGQRLEVGWTKLGIQVWCKRHDMNLLHIDFEGRKHPANTTATGGKAFTEEHRKKLLVFKKKRVQGSSGCHESFKE